MVTRVFTKEDTDLYSTWHLEDGGVVSLVVPDVGEVRMTLAKAEEVARSIERQAKYGRWASDRVEDKSP